MKRKKAVSCPKISIPAARTLVNKLYEKVDTERWYGTLLVGDDLKVFCAEVAWALSTKNRSKVVDPATVETAVSYLINQTIDFKALDWFFKFLSVNTEALYSNDTLVPMVRPPAGNRLYLIHIDSVEKLEDAKYNLRVLGHIAWGPSYGVSVYRDFSFKQRYFNSFIYKLGLTRRRHRFYGVEWLEGLYFFSRMPQTIDQTVALSFFGICVDDYLLRMNYASIDHMRKNPPPKEPKSCPSQSTSPSKVLK